jgi:hypothetical protein
MKSHGLVSDSSDKLTGWDGLTELASPETVVQTLT